MFEKPACPECGSHDVLPIVYGLPGPELEARAVRGEVVLGGCIVYDSAPDLHCKSCNAEWNDQRAKRLFEEHEGEDES
ncbi:MAG: hypothetical protein AB1598_06100 [Thermodesulfobacteriota bacterium]